MISTLVIGASENPERYAYKAIQMLLSHGHQVFALGNKAGIVSGIEFMTEMQSIKVDTVTLYIGAKNQTEELRNYIISLKPKRVIFNPGTENELFEAELISQDILVEVTCTLVLLQTGQY